MNKKILLCILALICISVNVKAAEKNNQVTIDLGEDSINDDATIQGAGSTAENATASGNDEDAIVGYGDTSKGKVRLDTSGDDPYVLEEYSPSEYATYDFSQVLPIKFDTEDKKQSAITNRANKLTLAKVDVTLHTKENVRGQDSKFGLNEYHAQASAPILYKGQNKLMFTVDYEMFDFDTDMRLNNLDRNKYGNSALGAELPDMQSLSFMMNYRYEIEETSFAGGMFNGSTIGVDVIVDSRSDKLFNSLDETNLTAMLSYRFPIFENQAITIMGGYISDFKIPFAGVGYQLNFGKTSYLNVGVPLTMVHLNSADVPGIESERGNFDFNYVLYGDLSAQLSYDILLGKLQVYSVFEWNTNSWARAAREDKRSRVFYTDFRLGAGVRADFCKYFYAKAEGGWAFGRNVYEERVYFDYNKGYDIDDSAYLKLEAGIVF